MADEQNYFSQNTNNEIALEIDQILKGEQQHLNLPEDEMDSTPFGRHEQIAAADGGSHENINFFDNSQEYDNADQQEMEVPLGNLNQQQQIQNEIKLEEQEDEPEEEFHSFTLERDVDPDELKDPDNYYEQLSMSFYNTHKKGDQITRRLIEQSLQAYLENKRSENQRFGGLVNKAGGSGCFDESNKKNVKVRVKVISNNHNSNENQKRNVFLFQQNKNSSQQDLDGNKNATCSGKNTTQRQQNIVQNAAERQNEIPRVLHHNQFQVTNSIKPHRYYIKENTEPEQSNHQKSINLAQLMQSNQPLGFSLNQPSEYTKYIPNSKQVVDMDAGFRGSIRLSKIPPLNQKEEENQPHQQQQQQLQQPQPQLHQRLSFTNKGINLLNHIPSKANLKNSAAPTVNAEEYSSEFTNINRVQTENNTPRNIKHIMSSRNNSGGQVNQTSKFNVGNQRHLVAQHQKEIFPSIKLEDEHVRYINTNEGLQVQGKNQIKLIKQNDFFEFAAQLYNTNKGGNPQNIPSYMMRKFAQNDQAFSTSQLQRISNQLQNKNNSNSNNTNHNNINFNQRQPIPYLGIKKEPISLTSR